jgi:hypothetical protein
MSKEMKLRSDLRRNLIRTLRGLNATINCIFSAFSVNSVVNLTYAG